MKTASGVELYLDGELIEDSDLARRILDEFVEDSDEYLQHQYPYKYNRALNGE